MQVTLTQLEQQTSFWRRASRPILCAGVLVMLAACDNAPQALFSATSSLTPCPYDPLHKVPDGCTPLPPDDDPPPPPPPPLRIYEMSELRSLAARLGVSPALAALPNITAFMARLDPPARPITAISAPAIFDLVYPAGAPTVDQFIDRLFMTGIWSNPGSSYDTPSTGFDMRGCATKQVNQRYNLSSLAPFEPGIDLLFPGALVQGRYANLGLGSLVPIDIPHTKRKPIPLVSNYAAVGGPFQTATSPAATASAVLTTIGGMVTALGTTTLNPIRNIASEVETTSSLDEMAARLNVDVKVLGVKFSSVFTTDRTSESSTVFVHILDSGLSVAIDRQGFRPSAFLFNGGLAVSDLETLGSLGQLGYDPAQPLNNNLPTYVYNVTYGREFIFTVTSDTSSTRLKRIIDITRGGFHSTLSMEDKKVLSGSRVKVVSLGGPSILTEAVIKSGDWKSYLDPATPVPFSSLVPISYQLTRWDNQPAVMSRTADYVTRECPGHKVEVRISNIYEHAAIVLKNAQDNTAFEIVSTSGDSGWIDIKDKMSGPNDEIILNDNAGQHGFLAAYKRGAQLEIRIDGEPVVGPGLPSGMDGYEFCRHVHSAFPAIIYQMKATGDGVNLKYRAPC
jgi:hypothetical protein